MSLAYIIKFRVNRADCERLLQEARSMGFGTISDYLRNKLFGPQLFIEKMLKENNTLLKDIHAHLCSASRKRKNNKFQQSTIPTERSRKTIQLKDS